MWAVVGLLLLLFISGMPIVLAVGAVVLFYVVVFADVPLVIIPQQTIAAIDSFLLLAIPMFLLTGQLMGDADITRRFIRFSQSLVGWMRGGIGQVNVLSSILMSGISGSGLADAAATGSVLIPIMKRSGYGAPFSAALTGCACAVIGPMIPPSIIMVLIGGLTSVSIARMFLGGIIPGLLLGLFFGIVVYLTARQRDFPRSASFSGREVVVSFWGALPSLGLPIIIIGGILAGVFTPTESAAVAVIYTIGLGLCYRQMSFSVFSRAVVEVGVTTATVLFIIGISGIFGWMLVSESIGDAIVEWLVGITTNQTLMLLLISGVFLLLGCFVDSVAILVLAIPVLMPLVLQLGIDPVAFGVIASLALATGLVTPPFGLIMFLMCRMADVRIEDFSKELIPLLGAVLAALVLIIIFPELILWLPDLIMGEAP